MIKIHLSNTLRSEKRAKKLALLSNEIHLILNSSMFRDGILRYCPTSSHLGDVAIRQQLHKKILEESGALKAKPDKCLELICLHFLDPRGWLRLGKKDSWATYLPAKFVDNNTTCNVGAEAMSQMVKRIGEGEHSELIKIVYTSAYMRYFTGRN